MKLTNYIRNAFIRAAMADVPSIAYDEQATQIVNKALDAMFAKVCPGTTRTKLGEAGWLEKTGVKTPNNLPDQYTWAPGYRTIQEGDAKTWKLLTGLAEKAGDQSKQRSELERKLHAVAYACTTRKALAEALPEFVKYLPADEPAAVRTLPAVANVVSDFVKAGWPKQKV